MRSAIVVNLIQQSRWGALYWVDDSLRSLSVGTTSGSITRDYIFLGGKRIAFVPLSSGNPYYYLSDHLGSTAVIASGDGKTVQWEADYFPFGAVRQVFTSIVGNNYEFTGYENDSETSYNYAVARFDSGRWGRFMSPDPYLRSMDTSNPQSFNRYSYVANNPSNLVDPSGLTAVNAKSINCMFDASGNCAGQGGGNLIMGNDIFDALSGAPGTYFNVDNGSITWGFSIDKWYADWAAIEAAAAANDARQTPEVEAECKQKVVDSVNTIFGPGTVTASNDVPSFFYHGAWNFNFTVAGTAAGQITQGRFPLTSGGVAAATMHVPSSYFWDPQHVWKQDPNSVTFTVHLDSANGNGFPIGTVLHFVKDVLGSGSRQPCPVN